MIVRFTSLTVAGVALGVLLGCSLQRPTALTPTGSNLRSQTARADRPEPCDAEVAARIDVNAVVRGARALPRQARPGPDRPAMVIIDSPNRDARLGGAKDVTAIVLHHTASAADAKRIGMFFSKPSAQVSANYVVGKKGTVVQCVPDSYASWHAGRSVFLGRDNVNQFSLGIEICNLGNDSDPYPETQYAALGRLLAYLMVTHGIGWNGVTRHRDIAIPAGRKIDTSNNFSLQRLRQAVAQAGGPLSDVAGVPPEIQFFPILK